MRKKSRLSHTKRCRLKPGTSTNDHGQDMKNEEIIAQEETATPDAAQSSEWALGDSTRKLTTVIKRQRKNVDAKTSTAEAHSGAKMRKLNDTRAKENVAFNTVQDKIQNLVSQLYSEGFESILVVVKVTDNTATHYASKLGKTFLDKWQNIPTDFLNLCAETIARDTDNVNHKHLKEVVDDNQEDDIGDTDSYLRDQTNSIKTESAPNHKPASGANKVLFQDTNNDITVLLDESVMDSDEKCEVEEVNCQNENENSKPYIPVDEEILENKQQTDDGESELSQKKPNSTKAKKVWIPRKNAFWKEKSVPKKGLNLIDFLKQDINQGTRKELLESQIEIGLDDKSSVTNDNREHTQNAAMGEISDSHYCLEELSTKLTEKEKRHVDVEGRAEKVIDLYNSFDSLLQKCLENGNVCLFCDDTIEAKHLKHHLDLHKKSVEATLETCSECGIAIPPSYIVQHACKTTRKPIPKNAVAVNRDLRDDIAFIETKLHWRTFILGTFCNYCDVSPRSLGHYRKHFMSQHRQKYGCMVCNRVIQGYVQLLKHMKYHNMGKDLMDQLKNMTDNSMKNKTIKCPKCDKVFAHKGSVKRHILETHLSSKRSLKFECPVCEKNLDSEKKLVHHVKVHRKRLFCDVDGCDEGFVYNQELERHKLLKHREMMEKSRPFLCSQCGQGFLRQNTMLNHMEWKHGAGDPQECDICHKMFRGKNVLFSHKKSHSQVLKYMCELCGVSYKQRSGLYHHKKKYHRDPNAIVKKFTCEVCNVDFARRTTFRHHIVTKEHYTTTQVINKKFVYDCKECDKKFGSKDRIDRHTASVHKNVTVSECKFCGKGFNDKSNLRQHLHIHTGKPSCDICKISFRSVSKVKEHMLEYHSNSDCPQSRSEMKTTGVEGNNILQSEDAQRQKNETALLYDDFQEAAAAVASVTSEYQSIEQMQISEVHNLDVSGDTSAHYHMSQPLNLITNIGSQTFTVLPSASITEGSVLNRLVPRFEEDREPARSVLHRLVPGLEEDREPARSFIDQPLSVPHEQWNMYK